MIWDHLILTTTALVSIFLVSSSFILVMGMKQVSFFICLLYFHSDTNVADNGVLVELMIMEIIFGAER